MSGAEIFNSYGAIGVTVVVLAGVVVYLYKAKDTLQKRYDTLQENRIQDAKDTRDKIAEPLDQIAKLTQKIYDNSITDKRGN